MPKYRKVTKQVDAWRWLNQPEQGVMPDWLKSILASREASMGIQTAAGSARLDIGPLVQLLTARPGDWIIVDAKGLMTACQHHDFEAQYELVPVTAEPPRVAEKAPAPAAAPPAADPAAGQGSPPGATPATPPTVAPVLPPAETTQPAPERPAAAPPVDAVAPRKTSADFGPDETPKTILS